MKNTVKRIFVEKKKGFDVDAVHLLHDLKRSLNLKKLEGVRIINRYDVAGMDKDAFEQSASTIFSEPNVDNVYYETLEVERDENYFAVEYLPGQYDQRADSAAQCVQILTRKEKPAVSAAKIYVLKGNIGAAGLDSVKKYIINPVDSREASLLKPLSLEMETLEPEDVAIVKGFTEFDANEMKAFMDEVGFAMSYEDLLFCQKYFRDDEKRNPTITELKVIDTYWSDHCRHTTFATEIISVDIEDSPLNKPVKEAFNSYEKARKYVYGEREKDRCLMDIATMGMRLMKKKGLLEDLEESEEINACSIRAEIEVDGKPEEWLVMFKNETHNHPTEIEPFGGAATCLGGAIRDPLSGRSYVYQAMRVTGSGDPRTPLSETLPGKLPQRKITTKAAAGYSSYGNQIGLATGQVSEVYHPGFVAKRMEVGAVIAGVPSANVVRESPVPGDLIVLVGGKTGRDGCGGATGSSKEHTEESILTCGAEVQKGNAPTERKIQRLFRNAELSQMIKKCNDFGAGGVSVAIGELAPSLDIDLDAVPKKYDGLDGTELAISESQERMAVVIEPANLEKFKTFADGENLDATLVARVTDTGRLVMKWRGKNILDISRAFLDSNGVKQTTKVKVKAPLGNDYFDNMPEFLSGLKGKDLWRGALGDLNQSSKKGLTERFDASVGASTVLMPYGGSYAMTPAQGMVAKLPVLDGETGDCTFMAYGFDPRLAVWSPFHGAFYSVAHSLAKITAMGGDSSKARLSLQEYFEKLGNNPEKWGKPFAALLGAFKVQEEMCVPAIGGKDSMSGTFNDLNVPPSLISFAVSVGKAERALSPEFKRWDNPVVRIFVERNAEGLVNLKKLKEMNARVLELIGKKKAVSAYAVDGGGVAPAIAKMAFGNRIGFEFNSPNNKDEWFMPDFRSIILEIDVESFDIKDFEGVSWEMIGRTVKDQSITVGDMRISLEELQKKWLEPLNDIFPVKEDVEGQPMQISYKSAAPRKTLLRVPKPRILIPVFPGTNSEYDTARAFEKAGGQAQTLVFGNLSSQAVEESIEAMVKAIRNSQIIAVPGGFSAGDEPDGSGKFIATVFRNPAIMDAVMDLIKNRDGLMLGICNGFQAFIKLGLVPYGEIRDMDENAPTLTFNKINRHVAMMARTKITSNLSPWFANVNVGDVHLIPLSHGEGRFVASGEEMNQLVKAGQIAAQYVDMDGKASYDGYFNPNGSLHAVEAITSPDGRILGKMGHSERMGSNVAKNIPGDKDQKIFEAGVGYFK
ncbi:MAG: phosphoribosylformylglycinamidine synthase [Peptostreptococcaceae bacterium]|nr:phosphoribosylformylglycinamidine synthase [Peptostreptococcaceae bacterium]